MVAGVGGRGGLLCEGGALRGVGGGGSPGAARGGSPAAAPPPPAAPPPAAPTHPPTPNTTRPHPHPRKYTFFKPKFIFYATYLSEKIGYWRYISIYRHLQRNPDNQIYPLFEVRPRARVCWWGGLCVRLSAACEAAPPTPARPPRRAPQYFENWCQDENRHGDFLAAVLKARPELLKDWVAKLWSRFFCLSVYITMYLNDHQRTEFYESIGLNTKQVRVLARLFARVRLRVCIAAILCLRTHFPQTGTPLTPPPTPPPQPPSSTST